jgi:multidrug efflux pump subunit AcrB
VAQQLQFLLSGIPITSVREDIRSVQVTGRAAGDIRLDPAKIEGFTWSAMRDSAFLWRKSGGGGQNGRPATASSRSNAHHYRAGDIADNLQPPDVSAAIMKQLQPIVDSLPPGYRIDMAGSIEESGKATRRWRRCSPS